MSVEGASVAGRAYVVGVAGNGSLALLKLVVGYLAGSQSLIADGWHSLADVGTNGAAWAAHLFARREPDDDHHYGHGKLEAFAGLAIGVALVFGGVAVTVSAFTARRQLEGGWHTWLAFGVAVLSLAGNLALAGVARRGAAGGRSDGLRALARDNASDALSSLLVMVAILGSAAGFAWPEPLATFVIGLVILVMGWASAREGFDVLMDRSDPELRLAVRRTAERVDEVRGVQSVRVHPVGGHVAVDMEISVDGSKTVEHGHEIAHSVEDAVTRAHPDVREVHVHVNPGQPPSEVGTTTGRVLPPEPGHHPAG